MLNKIITKSIKKSFTFLISLTILSSCKKNTTPTLSNAKITENTKFGAAIVDITIVDFNNLGFKLGDGCDVSFSNDYKLSNIPYYNGYYVKNGEPVIVAYPNEEKISITLNNIGIWNTAKLSTDYTVDITLNTAGKYLTTQEALGQSYSPNRDEYSSDEEFVNFRSMTGGNLKENFIYRGASPVNNSRNRAKYADNLLEKNKIKYIIDLADSKDDFDNYLSDKDFSSTYTKTLYEDNKLSLLNMSSSYSSETYKQSIVKGLNELVAFNDSPSYIHCTEGKDRTGFVCMLIEALVGATYDEMCKDYMETYNNYYNISKEKTPEKYDAIVDLYFNSFAEYLHNSTDINELKSANYVNDAKSYLKAGGMSDSEIDALVSYLTK